jgi:hypothetical protein
LLGVPVGSFDGFDDTGFGENAGFWHCGLLSRGKFNITGIGLVLSRIFDGCRVCLIIPKVPRD